jgi:SAM-dependent methyltransferase
MSGSPTKQRRALSTVRDGGRVELVGAGAEAAAIADALRLGPDDEAIARSLTHAFHTYPARLHPATARALVALGEPAVVLDPFCGAGTVLVEARYRGARGVGVDANPLAVMIARARADTSDAAFRSALRADADAVAARVIAEGKAARRAGASSRPHRRGGPRPEARERELEGWFAPHVRRELEALAAEVDAAHETGAPTAPALRAVLSSIIYKFSRRASDTSNERVERRVGRGAVARMFSRRAAELEAGLAALAAAGGPPARIVRGDARELATAGVKPGSADAIVTSPPYAGTYDYLEHQRLRMAFLGLAAGRFAGDEIGARRGFRADRGAASRRWERDLATVLAEMARALRPGGTAAIVIGDSLAGGRAIHADELIHRLRPDALERVAVASQRRPLLGRAEREAFERAPKREHVLLYRKR